jgi:hypothetical protein
LSAKLNVIHGSRSLDNAEADTSDMTEKLYDAVMMMIEYYVNKYIYDLVFPAISYEFKEQETRFQKRIRDLSWVTNNMIGTCIDEKNIISQREFQAALSSKYKVTS